MIEYIVRVYENRIEWFHPETKEFHRLNGPAVEWSNGDKEWWVDGKQHRLNGPAVEWSDGTKQWWVDGKRHRLNGPAFEWNDGTKQWWIDGKRLSEEEFLNRTSCQGKVVVIDGKKYRLEEMV